jgi:hypothetical protein
MTVKFPVDFRNLGTYGGTCCDTVHGTRGELCSPSLLSLFGGTTHLTRRQIILAAWADTAHRHLGLSSVRNEYLYSSRNRRQRTSVTAHQQLQGADETGPSSFTVSQPCSLKRSPNSSWPLLGPVPCHALPCLALQISMRGFSYYSGPVSKKPYWETRPSCVLFVSIEARSTSELEQHVSKRDSLGLRVT